MTNDLHILIRDQRRAAAREALLVFGTIAASCFTAAGVIAWSMIF
ncbi:hypothetical protein [Corynebacterium amycolatum]|nr:hypothetical protein [Corynebacterium amycolatum]MEB2597958.1 hypothetical protein [Corynebacterium amycolatum]